MKINPKKALLIGLAATTLFGTAGCETRDNEEPDVYGPPMDDVVIEENTGNDYTEEKTTEEITTEEKTTEKITTEAPKVNVDDNEPAVVYGPPEDL